METELQLWMSNKVHYVRFLLAQVRTCALRAAKPEDTKIMFSCSVDAGLTNPPHGFRPKERC